MEGIEEDVRKRKWRGVVMRGLNRKNSSKRLKPRLCCNASRRKRFLCAEWILINNDVLVTKKLFAFMYFFFFTFTTQSPKSLPCHSLRSSLHSHTGLLVI